MRGRVFDRGWVRCHEVQRTAVHERPRRVGAYVGTELHSPLPSSCRVGAPLEHDGVTPETFTKEKIVYQIGVAPVRIDISTHIDGVTFETAWQNRVQGSIFGEAVHFISL